MTPEVSIIIPAYNADLSHIQAFMGCFQGMEVIVVDDCSDSSIPFIPGVKIIRHTENMGTHEARKTGFYASSGKYVCFHDSDDPLSLLLVNLLLVRRRELLDSTHIAVKKRIVETGAIWEIKQHENPIEYLCDELSWLRGKLPFTDTLIPRSILEKSFPLMDAELDRVGVKRIEVCEDAFLMNVMIMAGYIKAVEVFHEPAPYAGPGLSCNNEKRLQNIPIMIAHVYDWFDRIHPKADIIENYREKLFKSLENTPIYSSFCDIFDKYLRMFKGLDEKTNTEITQFYDSFSSHLAQEVTSGGDNPRHQMIHEKLVRYCTPGGTALDLGCGIGITAYYMANIQGMNVTAVDISPENIRFAKENRAHQNIEYLCGDAAALSFGRTFDLICLCDILEHIPSQRVAAFLATVAAHSHDHTIIYLNVPDGRFQAHMRRFHPEALQIVDEVIDLKEILAMFYSLGFSLLEIHSRGLDVPAQYNEYIFVGNAYLEALYIAALKRYYPEGG